MTMIKTASDTIQRVEVESDEGKKFLRRVIRESKGCSDGWTINAAAREDWKVVFYRRIVGEPGTPDVRVEVYTDYRLHTRGKTGVGVKSFSDSKPVFVREPIRMYLSGGAAAAAARFMLDGAHLYVNSSSGSTASSEYGISRYGIDVEHPDFQYASLSIGYETLAINGRVVSGGSIDI